MKCMKNKVFAGIVVVPCLIVVLICIPFEIVGRIANYISTRAMLIGTTADDWTEKEVKQ